MKLTLDIINKIISNCKDNGTIYNEKELEYEVYEIRFIDEDKEFRSYNVIHYLKGKEESEDYWLIDIEEDTTIECDYYRALEGYEDYTLDNFYKEYEEYLETNKEVIELVTKYEQWST